MLKTLSQALLTDTYIGDRKYAVDLSFDNVIKYFKYMDPQLWTERRALASLFLLVPSAIEDAINGRLLLNDCYETLKTLSEYIGEHPYNQSDDQQVDITGEKIETQVPDDKTWDFDQDSMALYASFKQVYGIDLWDLRGKLHWAKFQAMLIGLPDDCQFRRIVAIRQAKLQPPSNPAQNPEAMRQYSQLVKQKADYALTPTDYEMVEAEYNYISMN
ncbi:hypothetical protein DY78_GL002367 [Lactiplantibacillus fabifermentans DSM 21115]|uniref:Bacteriophage Gp15 protein n=2 Tax=Lactiplantibacillus fabifermentans TaxID=483011 RepID=A0A0R2NS00_9LACO|nr:hypothetical protein DY78_GL002367 [Lactiplantibacillus fabifermentans DSM 21115]